jgi:hypothetical protein
MLLAATIGGAELSRSYDPKGGGSDWNGGNACLKLVTALPWREYKSDSIQWSSMAGTSR